MADFRGLKFEGLLFSCAVFFLLFLSSVVSLLSLWAVGSMHLFVSINVLRVVIYILLGFLEIQGLSTVYVIS